MFLRPWDFPGKNTGVSCYFLLQEIFPTQGLNLGLTQCRQMLYRLRHKFSSVQSLSLVRLFATPWTVARQAPLTMGFSRQEYWCGWPFPSPGDLPDPGIKPTSPAFPASAGGFFTTEPPGKPYIYICIYLLFQILSLYRVLKILFSVLHSRPYWLSILYIVV